MRESLRQDSRRYDLLSLSVAALLFLTAAFVYSRYGTEGELYRDGAIYVYSGQQIVQGVPPYVSMFDHKGPLASFLCAAGVWAAELMGKDEMLCIRALFLALSCATVSAVFWLVHALFESRWQAFLSSLVFLGFYGFGAAALGGPDPKTPVVLLQVLALVFLTRRRWFWASFCGSLAALSWQPTGIYSIAAFVLAYFQASRRGPALAAAALGTLVPWIASGVYFLAHGALADFVDGILTFNLRYLETPTSLRNHLAFMLTAVIVNFRAMGFLIALGLCVMPLLYAWRMRATGLSFFACLVRDRFSSILATFPLPVIWSLLDFQGYADFFIFLPYAAVAFGWLLEHGLASLSDLARLSTRGRFALRCAICSVLFLGCTCVYWSGRPRRDLQEQRAAARRLIEEHGADLRVVSVGVPEALVFLRRTNPSRYGFIMRGIHRHIDAHTSGGFRGWLDELDASNPDVLVVGRDLDFYLPPAFAAAWNDWLARYERDPDAKLWDVYVRRPS